MVFNTIAVLVYILLLVETVWSVKYLTLNGNDCNEYRHYFYDENDEYVVRWKGQTYPKYCSLRFSPSGMDTSKLCASVEQFILDCSITLKFYWGVEMDVQKYDCNRDITLNPIQYCNDGVVYMTLEPEYYGIRSTSSSLRIRVKATLKEKWGKDVDFSVGTIIGIVIGSAVGFIFLIAILFIVCRLCSNNQGSSFGGRTVRYPTADVQRQGEGVHVSLMNQQGQFNPPRGQYQEPGVQYYPPGDQPPGGQYQPSGGQYQPSAGLHTGQYYPPQPSAPSGQHNTVPSAPPGQYNAPPPSYKDCIGKECELLSKLLATSKLRNKCTTCTNQKQQGGEVTV